MEQYDCLAYVDYKVFLIVSILISRALRQCVFSVTGATLPLDICMWRICYLNKCGSEFLDQNRSSDSIS